MSDEPTATATGDATSIAGRLAGLLADDDRRLVWAAVVLGAGSLGEVAATTGLDEPRTARALSRLRAGGLVTGGAAGELTADPAPLREAARAASQRDRDAGDGHDGQPDEVRKVLRSFVAGGRITALPTNRTKRRLLLDWLVQRFEPGRRYPEREATELLDGHAVDRVTLRRFLVDEDFLSRDAGEYWRSGGSVDAGGDMT